MDAQQLKEIERYVMGTMGVVLLVMWLFVKWALKKSREFEEEESLNKRKDELKVPSAHGECLTLTPHHFAL